MLLSVLLSFTACTFRETPDQTEDPSIQEHDPSDTAAADTAVIIDRTDVFENASSSYLSSLPAIDYEGASFVIATPRPELIDPSESSTAYSVAKYERNKKVEEKYNIRIVSQTVDESTYAETVRLSVQADEYFADLLMIPQYTIGTFVADGSLMNLNSLPFFRTDVPYFDASSVEAASIGNNTYAVAGPASFDQFMPTAVFFNRDLFEANGLTLPYEDVYANTWTWDRFFELCASVESINASTGTSLTSYATQYSPTTLPSAVFFSCGEQLIGTENGTPSLAYTDSSADAVSVLKTLFGDPNAHTESDTGVNSFYTGKSLFLIDRLYLTSWMINGSQNWGILPLPKMSSEQPYYVSLAAPETLFFAAQTNAGDAESTSVILSALNAASYGLLPDAYITDAMHHTLRDNDSANMMEILYYSRTYDFSVSFANPDETLYAATIGGLDSVLLGREFSDLLGQAEDTNTYLADTYPSGN